MVESTVRSYSPQPLPPRLGSRLTKPRIRPVQPSSGTGSPRSQTQYPPSNSDKHEGLDATPSGTNLPTTLRIKIPIPPRKRNSATQQVTDYQQPLTSKPLTHQTPPPIKSRVVALTLYGDRTLSDQDDSDANMPLPPPPSPKTLPAPSLTRPSPNDYAPSTGTPLKPVKLLPESHSPPRPTQLLPESYSPPQAKQLLPESGSPPQPTQLLPESYSPPQPTQLLPESYSPAQPTQLLPESYSPPQPTQLLPESYSPPQPTQLLPESYSPPQPTQLLPESYSPPQPTQLLPESYSPPQPRRLVPYPASPKHLGSVVSPSYLPPDLLPDPRAMYGPPRPMVPQPPLGLPFLVDQYGMPIIPPSYGTHDTTIYPQPQLDRSKSAGGPGANMTVSDGANVSQAVVGVPVEPKVACAPVPGTETVPGKKAMATIRLENDWLTKTIARLFSFAERKETDEELDQNRERHRAEQSWFDKRAFSCSELEKNRSAYRATDVLLEEGLAALDRFEKDKVKCQKWIDQAVDEYERLEGLRVGGERLRQKEQAMVDISDWVEYLDGALTLITQLAAEVEKHNDVFWLYLKRLGKEEKQLWRGWMEAEKGLRLLYKSIDETGEVNGLAAPIGRRKVVKFKADYLETRQFFLRGRDWIAPERKFQTMAYIAQKRRRDYHVLETSERFQIVLSDYPVCPVAPERILGHWNDLVLEPIASFIDRWRPRKHAKGYC